MYHWRVFLWENGHKSTEYTDYLTAPIFIEDRLDETLDTGEIILKSMPIATKAAFPPKTKFRLERYLTESCTDAPKTWDFVVDHDDVEEYEGCSEICTHRIHLIEPSAIAQGMHVDNIALTYELKDVTLNYTTIQGITDTIKDMGRITASIQDNFSPLQACPKMSSAYSALQGDNKVTTIKFINSYRYVWENTASIENLKAYYHGEKEHNLSFTLPTLTAQGAKSGRWFDIVETQIQATVKLERLNAQDEVIETVQTIEKKCGAASFPTSSADNRIYQFGQETAMGGAGDLACLAVTILSFASESSKVLGLVTSLDDLTEFEDKLNISSGFVLSEISSDYQDSKSINITIPKLSEDQMRCGEKYRLSIYAKAAHNMPSYYECKCDVGINQSGHYANNTKGLYTNRYSGWGSMSYVSNDDITFSASLLVEDKRTTLVSHDFMRRKARYNAYKLLRKAIMTCDTYIVPTNVGGIDGLQLPIEVDTDTKKLLEATEIHETIFEQKNLWEVLLSIGYYIHSIPFLEFADDGDYFSLKYKKLGDPDVQTKDCIKKTVFNSLNLFDFFTQYDSYVTNMYSPQNIVDESGVVKTSNANYLISNNTAELHTKYPILELLKLEIKRGDSGAWCDITDRIFEKSVYSVLTSYANISPSKGNSLYYTLGDNKILGMDFVPQTATGDVPLCAFKKIIESATGQWSKDSKGKYPSYSEYKYHIRYRTQDSLRVSQFRPDLHKFMKNSSREKYPHHEQFYGQQDKVIDSERFSTNLFGRLIRVANGVYQQQEYTTAENEKESGYLVEIDGDPYYVTAIDNEYYPDAILQKVTYSKNFNQLANIVTIPSEPRFYEVSERSIVRREIRLNDFLLLSANPASETCELTFADSGQWKSFVKDIIFGDSTPSIPNYAFICYTGDKTRYDNTLYQKLFPSSETSRADENTVTPNESKSHCNIAVPTLCFPMASSIMFEFDMDDNFKAGDFADTSNTGGNDDDAYISMQAARYCDLYGGADLFEFSLFYKTNWTHAQSCKLPILESAPSKIFGTKNNQSVVIDKDNREALSFNYQINLLQESREFITFANLFVTKKSRLKMCFLKHEIEYLNPFVEFSNATVFADDIPYNISTSGNAIKITINGSTADEIKAIVLYEEVDKTKNPCLARNVAKRANSDKLGSWYIYPAIFR